MDDNKLFTVTTTIEKEDYRRFLYIATFLRSKIIIPFFVLLSCIVASFLAYSEGQLNILRFIVLWIVLTALDILTLVYNVERKNKQRIKIDKTGAFDAKETLDFYDDYLVIKSAVFGGKNKVKYDQIYQVLETKEYFITYLNINQASIMRKKDMDKDTIEKIQQLYKKSMGKMYKKIKY